jgi:hypothetical protein
MGEPRLGADVTDLMPKIGEDVSSLMEAETPQAPPADDSWSNALSTYWHTINPVEAIKTVAAPVRDLANAGWRLTQGDLEGAGQSASQALEPLRQLGAAHGQLAREAGEAYQGGDYLTAARKGANYLLLGVGPALDQASDDFAAGRPKQGTARALGVGTNLVAPAAVGGVSGRIPSPLKGPTSVKSASAVAYGQSRGIPVDAATATGNRFVRGAAEMSDATLPGSIVAEPAKQAFADAMTGEARALAQRASPTPGRYVTAGQQVKAGIQRRIDRLDARANQAYDRLRAIEADPANSRRVSMRIPTTDAAGNTTMSMVSMDMPLPVDLKSVKQSLEPLREAIERQMPVTQRQASPGLLAINNVLDSYDYMPASIVDVDLSAIKALARSKKATPRARGLAKKVVSELEDAVQAAVQAGGPQAVQARLVGRASTAAKYNTAEILATLRKEPTKVVKQLLEAEDGAIEQLRAVARVAPQQMPQLGRAYLERLFAKAGREGGQKHADWMFAEWHKLGPQAKMIVYKDRQLVADLDNFFQLAKDSAERVNPSGTGPTIGAIHGTAAGLSYAVINPAGGAAILLAPLVISKLLHSRAGVRALTQGLSVPVSNRLAASTAAARILKLAGEDGVALSMSPARLPLPAVASEESQSEP